MLRKVEKYLGPEIKAEKRYLTENPTDSAGFDAPLLLFENKIIEFFGKFDLF